IWFLLVLLCEISLMWLSTRPWPGAWPPRGVPPGGLVPMIDACFFITPQHLADHRGNPCHTRTRFPQQLREHGPHLRHRHCWGFFFPTAATPTAKTTAPTATASGGGASPPSSAPRSGPAPLPPCLAAA